ncbi:hypothetical protein [Siphonobacter sp.]|uniref:hypothetical protein n=1 Tax=Siphonobacter sp. TaxID=1869184 RepID=UPI003B3BBFE0
MSAEYKEVIHPNVPDAVFLPSSGALIRMDTRAGLKDKVYQPLTPQRLEHLHSLGVALWGDDNQFPNRAYDSGKVSTIIGGENGIPFLIRAIYGDGIEYGIERYDAEKKEMYMDQTPIPELNKLLYSPATQAALQQSIHDHFWFRNRMPRLIFSANKNKVVSLFPGKAIHTRWALQNTSGLIERCFMNANWDLFAGTGTESKETINLPVINSHDFLAQQKVQKDLKNFDYVFRSYDASNADYYQMAPWQAAIESGWYDVAMLIPKFKKFLLENQMTIKYIIVIPDWWWADQAGGQPAYDAMTPEARVAFHQKKKQEINDFLSGLENSGKSLFTSEKTMGHGFEMLNTPLEGLRVKLIDKETFSGEYLEDSAEASTHLMWALGIDPRLIGDAPGSNRSGGAGSDKEEAFNIFLNLCKSHADAIFEPLLWAARYNGIDPDYSLRIWFKRPFFRAKSETTPSKRNTVPEPETKTQRAA